MTPTRARIVLSLLLLGAGFAFTYRMAESPLWFDEAVSYRMAAVFSADEMLLRAARDVHPPLYYALLRAWIGVFGSTVVAMRGLSVLLSLATLLASFRLCTLVYPGDRGRRIGLTAVALIGTSTLLVQHAWNARMYSLLDLLAVSSCVFLVRALRGSERDWLAYSLCAAAALYTHNAAIPLFAGQVLYLLLGRRRDRKAWLAVALVVLLYSPWMPTLLLQAQQVHRVYWSGPLDREQFISGLVHTVFPPTDVWVPWNEGLRTTVALTLILLIAAGFMAVAEREEWLLASMALAVPLLILLYSTFGRNFFMHRYLSVSFLFLCILAARVIWTLPSRRETVTCLVLFLALNLSTLIDHVRRSRCDAALGVRGAAELLAREFQPGDRILVMSPEVYLSLDYYLGKALPMTAVISDPPADHFQGGAFLGAAETSGMETLDSAAGRIWSVKSTGYSYTRLHPIAVPPYWTLLQHRSLPEPYHFQKTIEVRLYRASSRPEAVRNGSN